MSSFSLFRRGKIWQVRFQMDGTRRQRSTRETVYAKAKMVACQAYDDAKVRARGEEPEPFLVDLVQQWLRVHEPIRADKTWETVERFGRLHLGDLAYLRLRELSTVEVEDARLVFLATHGASSANLWLSTLRSVCGWAIRRKMLREIPWQVKKLKVQRKPKVLLPVDLAGTWLDEVDRLAAEDPGIALVIRLGLGVGLRVSEALGAQWEWMDWDRRLYTPGKTKGREAWPRPLPEWILQELDPIRKAAGPMVPQRPGRRITDDRVRKVMNKANDAVEGPHVTPHRLRGTYATLLAEAGVPIQDIQRALGHKDIRTTIGYLEHLLDRVSQGQAAMARRLKLNSRGRESGAVQPVNPHQGSIPELSGVIRSDPESEAQRKENKDDKPEQPKKTGIRVILGGR